MTKEILFIGKRVDNGEWVVGDLIHRQIWKCSLTIIRVSDDGFDHYEEYEVIPETVGQFTGLTDKNSKKIFEGDIIAKGFELYEVRWNPEQVRWGIYLDNYEVAGFTKFSESYFEVVGNIYDNRELLNGKDKG